MAGGIQIGSTAWDTDSRALESVIRSAALEVSQSSNLMVQRKLTKSQIPYGVGALSPDGFCWFHNGKLVLVVEAKKQNNRGNAIERWFKNNYIARLINPGVTYLTFASGEGADKNGTIYNALYIAHEGQYNVIRPRSNTAFLSVTGFDRVTVVEILNETLTRLGLDKQQRPCYTEHIEEMTTQGETEMMTAIEKRETEAFKVVTAERPAEYTSWLYEDNGRSTMPIEVLSKVDALDNKRAVREVIKLAAPLNGEEGKKIRHKIYCSADKGYAKIVEDGATIIVLYNEKKAS